MVWRLSDQRKEPMILTGNTIFITGGGSGIGRGLAEALHQRGNQIIISGRRKSHLAAAAKANPGMASVELDLQDPNSIATVAKKVIARYPKLNVLINNAGIMQIDDAASVVDDSVLVSTVHTFRKKGSLWQGVECCWSRTDNHPTIPRASFRRSSWLLHWLTFFPQAIQAIHATA